MRAEAGLPILLLSVLAGCAGLADPPGSAAGGPRVRVALFNVEELTAAKLAAAEADPQLTAAAAILRRLRPDVVVLQEVDVDPADPAAAARRFAERYLAGGEPPLVYPHVFAAPVNTGVLSGFDLDNDGRVATAAQRGERAHGDDSLGFGLYPGQYGMAVLSRLPLAAGEARTFRRLLWRDLPGAHLPAGFYGPEELAVLPLSSKSHWDLPVEVGGRRLHLLISHPTPPVFDGPEDRNGRRNFDEVTFWVRYLDGDPGLTDDAGRSGGLPADALFVVAGDLNADPLRPAGTYDGTGAVAALLAHPRLVDPGAVLVSDGARAHGRGGAPHPEQVTATFAGGMRVDYLLPSRRLEVVDGGVYWPDATADPEGARLAGAASDHHLVWLDLRLPRP